MTQPLSTWELLDIQRYESDRPYAEKREARRRTAESVLHYVVTHEQDCQAFPALHGACPVRGHIFH